MDIPCKSNGGIPVLGDAVLAEPAYIIHLAKVGRNPVGITKLVRVVITFGGRLEIIKMQFQQFHAVHRDNGQGILDAPFKKLNAVNTAADDISRYCQAV
jgi:hypothetical protein